MKRIFLALFITSALMLTTGCERLLMGDDVDASAKGTFDYLWKTLDEQYSEFDVKDADWNAVRDSLSVKIDDNTTSQQLFDICSQMLDPLMDGHVNLISGFDTYHNGEVYRMMAEKSNIDDRCVRLHYLKPDYHTASGFQNNDIGDGVLYILYRSFSNPADSSRLRQLVERFDHQHNGMSGIVLDLRQNGGGSVQNIWNILGLFESHGQPLYSTRSKTGAGHEDFGEARRVHADENADGLKQKVVVLTDRGSYSAASFFTLCAKEYDNFTIIGDTTGGGLGLPRGGQLPNGWYYRFSGTRTYSNDGVNYENGVPPDEVVILDRALAQQGTDNVIERAKEILLQK